MINTTANTHILRHQSSTRSIQYSVLLACMALAVLAGSLFFGPRSSAESKKQIVVDDVSTRLGSSNRALRLSPAFFAPVVAPMPPALFTYSDTIVTGSPTYARPIANGTNPPITLSAQIVRYSAFTFTVDTTGTYVLTNLANTFNSATPNDSFFTLYISSFNPASPLSNALVANDNGPVGVSPRAQITRTLTAGTVYILVTSPFSANGPGSMPAIGAFTNEINGPGTVSVATPCPFITIAPSSLPPASTGIPYTQTLVATGGTGPYGYAVTSGSLPPGLLLVADTIAGTPTTAGSFSFTITATDANGCVGSQSYLIVVTDPTVQNCYSDSLMPGGPTFARPSITDTQASGIPAGGCALSPAGTNVFYKTYQFDISGCSSTTLTATLCDGAGCGPVTGAGSLANSAMYLYRTGGLTAGTGAPGAFTPAASCTNLAAANDNLNGTASSGGLASCSANTSLSGLRRTVGPGRVTIVVAGVNNGQTGAYNLQVSAPGCIITPVPACTTINGTVTGDQTICPGASATVSVSVSGGTPPYTVSLDNGGGSMSGVGPFNFTVTPSSTTTYTATGTDVNGCPITMSGTATVTVSDTTPPTVTCPADSSASADSICMAAVPDYASAATASDNCTASGSITKTQSPAAGTMVGLGPHTVTVTATDASGNSSNCTTTFTVNDTTAPTVTAPADSSASADASCMAAVPDYASASTTSDNCGPVTVTQSPAAGTMVGLGPHTVTVTATDGANNSSNDTVVFTVNDTTAPTVTAPADSSASANASCMAAVPDYASASTTSDNCGPVTVTQSPAAGTMVGLGPHTVTVTATDGANNSSNDTVVFTVNDTTGPTVTAPADSSASADASCMAAVPDYAAASSGTDNCSPSGSITFTQSPAAGTMVGQGPHTVTVTGTDQAGNTGTDTVVFTVNDTTGPAVTAPADSSASADASCMAAIPNYAAGSSGTDNCSPSGSITFTQSPAAGTMVGLGPHTVTVTGTDQAGNTGTDTVVFTVNDTTAPVITCPANIVRSTDPNTCSATVNPGTATATDNCSVATVTGTRSDGQPLNAPYPKGTTTITWTATDGSGNTSSCQQTVTVNDTQVPTITCPANITTAANPSTCNANVNPGTATATDNCPGVTVTGTRSDGKPLTDPYPGGTTTITWTATDSSGNTSSCTQTVTVTDTTGPVITLNGQSHTMWPPNHSYHTFTVANFVSGASDSCDPTVNLNSVYIVKVTSDEVENGNGDGNTFNDIVIAANCKSVQLRSEREGSGNGRVYTIFFAVKDAAGNTATATTKVTVPKSQNGNAAVDSGPHYTVNSNCP